MSLVYAGRLQFALRNSSVIAAMQSALGQQSLVFSAWRNLEPGSKLRAAVDEALRTGRPPTELDDETRRKIEGVRRLASAIAQVPRVQATDARWRLGHLVAKSWDWLPKPMQAALADKELPVTRSEYYELTTKLDLGSSEVVRAKEVVDGCYNNVVASAVGAEQVMLTATERELQEAFAKGAPARRIAPVIGFDAQESSLSDTLREINWRGLRDFLVDRSWRKPTEQDLRDVAGFLASVRVKNHTFYSIATRSTGMVAGGLIWGSSALLGSWLTGGSEPTVIGTTIGAAVPAIWAGDHMINGAMERFFTGRVKKRFYGILEQRLVDV
jgi:hypothetical protein